MKRGQDKMMAYHARLNVCGQSISFVGAKTDINSEFIPDSIYLRLAVVVNIENFAKYAKGRR